MSIRSPLNWQQYVEISQTATRPHTPRLKGRQMRIHHVSTILAASAALGLSGCASIINDSTHPLRIETKTAEGEAVAGAECKVTNDYHMAQEVKSGSIMQVRRSAADLDIVCRQAGQPDATAKAISRPNAGLFGNILLGGVIGAVIDHTKGTAYSYPRWLVLIFGRELVFDARFDYGDGPVAGQAPKPPESAPENPRQTNEQMQRW